MNNEYNFVLDAMAATPPLDDEVTLPLVLRKYTVTVILLGYTELTVRTLPLVKQYFYLLF